jgi:hypothetical protein
MYSVRAIFKSSIVWGLIEYTAFFIAKRLSDHLYKVLIRVNVAAVAL